MAALAFGTGCSKSGAATPEELIKNYADAFAKKNAAAVVSCLSKENLAENITSIRKSAESDPAKLERHGLTRDDLKLSDEKFLVKLLSKKFEKGDDEIAALSELAVLKNQTEGEKGVLRVKNKNGRILEMHVAKQDGFWKLEKISSLALKESAAYNALYSIVIAESSYHSLHIGYGTLEELGESGALKDKEIASGKQGAYTFQLELKGNDDFDVTAVPDDPDLGILRATSGNSYTIKRPGTADFVSYTWGE